MYVADVQQAGLVVLPLRDSAGPLSDSSALDEGDRLAIDNSLAGLAYRTQRVQLGSDGTTAWLPMIDGIERVGVMEAGPGVDPGWLDACKALASLATLLVISKTTHNDQLIARGRSRPMTLQAELLWAFLPPRTIGTREATSTAVLEPAYDIGGDVFDHGFANGRLHLALLDAMGHDLAAGGASAVGLAACRSTRRSGGTLADIARTIDSTLGQWIPNRLMTGIIAELDTRQGELTWVNCGHPAPLLIRGGHVRTGALERPAQLPLGFGFHTEVPPAQYRTRLEPGDRVLLYSDGVTEARSTDKQLFGETRLADTIIRSMAAGEPAPEALRRLIENLMTHQNHHLNDDATILLAEWHPTH
ncbi:PP2C family protein-serine/threonine phosphatase [Streptomyces sp. NPDC056527]|uniref:PP2C family protein-serine/threonine phosphatase n=1 Tax=Streptomyces sp. NPDC056527 TaxID=3345853 RepID=UPI0036BC4815